MIMMIDFVNVKGYCSRFEPVAWAKNESVWKDGEMHVILHLIRLRHIFSMTTTTLDWIHLWHPLTCGGHQWYGRKMTRNSEGKVFENWKLSEDAARFRIVWQLLEPFKKLCESSVSLQKSSRASESKEASETVRRRRTIQKIQLDSEILGINTNIRSHKWFPLFSQFLDWIDNVSIIHTSNGFIEYKVSGGK